MLTALKERHTPLVEGGLGRERDRERERERETDTKVNGDYYDCTFLKFLYKRIYMYMYMYTVPLDHTTLSPSPQIITTFIGCTIHSHTLWTHYIHVPVHVHVSDILIQ